MKVTRQRMIEVVQAEMLMGLDDWDEGYGLSLSEVEEMLGESFLSQFPREEEPIEEEELSPFIQEMCARLRASGEFLQSLQPIDTPLVQMLGNVQPSRSLQWGQSASDPDTE